MRNILRVDSRFMEKMRHAMFFALVNILWLVGCIPIVSIGLSTTALYDCLLAYRRTKAPGEWKRFFRSIRRNWKQAVPAGILLELAGGLIALSIWSTGVTDLPAKLFFISGAGVAAVLWVCAALYFFPLLAQFDNSGPALLRTALVIGLCHFPSTLALLTMWMGAFFLCSASWYLLPLWSFGGFALTAYLTVFIYRRVFVRYGATVDDAGGQCGEIHPKGAGVNNV